MKLPSADVLVHAGDATNMGYRKEAEQFHYWFIEQPHKRKILIAGNHDFNREREYYAGLDEVKVLYDSMGNHYTYLRDGSVEVGGLTFYGSPWTPKFGGWAFMRPRGEGMKEKWDLIPDKVDVLITHGPPNGILDQPFGSEDGVGCDDLLTKVLQIKPKIHVFGHIHGSYGIKEFNGTTFINASVVNEQYKLSNEPVVIDIL